MVGRVRPPWIEMEGPAAGQARPTRRARKVLTAVEGDKDVAVDMLLGDQAPTGALHVNTDSEEMCVLCADDAAPKEAVRLRPCGHGWFWAIGSAAAPSSWSGASAHMKRCPSPCDHLAPWSLGLWMRRFVGLCQKANELVSFQPLTPASAAS